MLQKCGIIGHWVSHESLGRLCDVDAMPINATAVDTFKIGISTKVLSKIEMPFVTQAIIVYTLSAILIFTPNSKLILADKVYTMTV